MDQRNDVKFLLDSIVETDFLVPTVALRLRVVQHREGKGSALFLSEVGYFAKSPVD